jgi:hypothetical protein
MASIDLKKLYREHYSAKADVPALVHVPARPYLMIDGKGDPNTSEEYRDAVEALYPLAYGLRAAIKTATGDAYTVMPLEGLWWVADAESFAIDDKSNWLWTAMICLPDSVTEVPATDVLAEVTAKKHLAAGSKARVEGFGDGDAAQILHIGPYADEAPTIATLHDFITAQGRDFRGKHHEIYLSDARKVDPARLCTILRQPVAEV